MIISPLSTAMALSLLKQGTNGKTFEELQKGLHFNSSDKAKIANQFHQYYESLKKSDGQSELLVANQIFIQQDCTINPNFHEVATKQFFLVLRQWISATPMAFPKRSMNLLRKIQTKESKTWPNRTFSMATYF